MYALDACIGPVSSLVLHMLCATQAWTPTNTMQRVVKLPTGPKVGWELDGPAPEGGELRSVPERCVP